MDVDVAECVGGRKVALHLNSTGSQTIPYVRLMMLFMMMMGMGVDEVFNIKRGPDLTWSRHGVDIPKLRAGIETKPP